MSLYQSITCRNHWYASFDFSDMRFGFRMSQFNHAHTRELVFNDVSMYNLTDAINRFKPTGSPTQRWMLNESLEAEHMLPSRCCSKHYLQSVVTNWHLSLSISPTRTNNVSDIIYMHWMRSFLGWRGDEIQQLSAVNSGSQQTQARYYSMFNVSLWGNSTYIIIWSRVLIWGARITSQHSSY